MEKEKENVIVKEEKDLKTLSKEFKLSRTKIANMVKRKPEIKKQCCICGKENAEILHNRENPYVITFICKECRADEEKLKQAENSRFDIRALMDKSKLSAKNFITEDVKLIVNNYLLDTTSIATYCKNIGISRHQFNQLLERYKKLFEDNSIKKRVLNHANKVNRKLLSELADERNGF